MRRNLIFVGFALVAVLCFSANAPAGPPGFVQTGVSNLNTHKIELDYSYEEPNGGTTYMFVAFIPTDSRSRACLTGANVVIPASEKPLVVCEYKYSSDGSNVEGGYIGPGVRVQVFWGYYEPIVSDYAKLTIIQDGATQYGETLHTNIFW